MSDPKRECVQSEVFSAERARVEEAARAFFTRALPAWIVTNSAEGFVAAGTSWGRSATARFCFEPATGGTQLTVTLSQNRNSPLPMWRVNYFKGQARSWLGGTRVFLEYPPADSSVEGAQKRRRAVTQSTRGERMFRVMTKLCLILFFFVYFVPSVIGLLTGNLWMLTNGGEMTIHGTWARIISAAVVAFSYWIGLVAWRMVKGGPARG